MAKIATMASGQRVFWIDRDNFIMDELWYQVDEECLRGRIRAHYYWQHCNEVIKANVLTEAGFADSRPKESAANEGATK